MIALGLTTVRNVIEILHLAAMAYTTFVDSEHARKNNERDEKIKALETELAEMKAKKAAKKAAKKVKKK